MSDQPITTRIEDNIGVLTINRPDTLNALDTETLEALEQKFAELEKDASVHVIVITGAGERAFVAGGNIALGAEVTSAAAGKVVTGTAGAMDYGLALNAAVNNQTVMVLRK